MVLATRVDPLINELTNLSLGAETATAVKTACLEALSLVLKNGGKKSKKEEIVGAALEASKELVNFGGDEGVRLAAGKVMGSVVGLLGGEVGVQVLGEEGVEEGEIGRCEVTRSEATS